MTGVMARTLIAVGLLSLALVLAACGSNQPKPAGEGPRFVEVVYPGPATAERLEAVGTVQRRREITLAFRLAGVLTNVVGEEGDIVRKGQVVATLDPTAFNATLSRMASDRDRLRQNAARTDRLFASGYVSAQRVQDDHAALAAAEAAYRAAAFDRRGATMFAPATGFILQRAVQAGEVVQPGQAVLRIADGDSALIVRAAISDQVVAGLRLGEPAEVRYGGPQSQPVIGRVSRIGERADASTGGVYVEVELPPDAVFRSGQIVSVTLRRAENQGLVAVPTLALVEVHGSEAVLLTYDAVRKVARRQRVNFVGLVNENALVSGLPQGVAVITTGGSQLDDGQLVRVAPSVSARG